MKDKPSADQGPDQSPCICIKHGPYTCISGAVNSFAEFMQKPVTGQVNLNSS